MKYLRVKNFHQFQHDTSKALPWIKFHTALLAPAREVWYSELPDAQKALLHHVWLMARVFNGRVPEDWLTQGKLNLKTKPNLSLLLSAGAVWFEDENGLRIESDSVSSHTRDARSVFSKTLSSPVEETKPEINQDECFESLWMDYPRAIGRKSARKAFGETVRTAQDFADCRAALAAYAAEMVGVEKRFIAHGDTWFRRWREHVPALRIVEDLTQRTRLADAIRSWEESGAGNRSDDAAMRARFGFTRDEFNSADDEQIATWFAAQKGAA